MVIFREKILSARNFLKTKISSAMTTKISTYARVRPIPENRSQASYSLAESDSKNKSNSIKLHVPLESRQQTSTNVETAYDFKFDKIFDQSTKQETIFQELAIPSIESCLRDDF